MEYRSAKLAVRNQRHEILTLNRAAGPGGGSGPLDLPGGKVEAGESTAAGATRELYEETGLTAAELRPIGSYSVVVRGRLIGFQVFAADCYDAPVRLSVEHVGFRWQDRTDLNEGDWPDWLRPAVGFIRAMS